MSETVTVEMKRVPEGENTYRVVATLTVAPDQTYTLDDPDERFPFYLAVPITVGPGAIEQVWFGDDPARWAKNLPSLLRTGYLVPEVTVTPGGPDL